MSAQAEVGFFGTTIGKKYLMGLTGLIWAGFVLAHMAGNLLIFVSPAAYNSYGHALVSGNIIYVAETVLVLALITHVFCAVTLTRKNRLSSGGSRYAVAASGAKAVAPASRMMMVHGTVLLVFIITHLAAFKYGSYYETTVNGVVMRDLHRLVLELFHQPGYVAWYVVALIFLAFHLSHGVRSIFQSFGLLNVNVENPIKKAAWGYAILVAAGFLSQPLYVYFIAG